jgi:hypothetical protein
MEARRYHVGLALARAFFIVLIFPRERFQRMSKPGTDGAKERKQDNVRQQK